MIFAIFAEIMATQREARDSEAVHLGYRLML